MERPTTYGLWFDRKRRYKKNEWTAAKCLVNNQDGCGLDLCEWCDEETGEIHRWPVYDAQWDVPGNGLCEPCMQHWLDWRACPFRPRRQDRQLAHLHCAFWHKDIGAYPRILNRIALFCFSNQRA